ncbi:hypothetical protein AKJ66_04485 [candidate division MSBL1 archaeon SCGC-AAA259E22]|uniref:Uncharacterized protein n=1 Tax=candidate division MSBL1 archaeon SCGC-AAA259E22 TaxID=1698265 RepID=A0A133UDG5_9EURY|nr:hypothetical protein AKJ66_04485 [candidate division MSBL1 archaeon SCGC-AAA259E22]
MRNRLSKPAPPERIPDWAEISHLVIVIFSLKIFFAKQAYFLQKDFLQNRGYFLQNLHKTSPKPSNFGKNFDTKVCQRVAKVLSTPRPEVVLVMGIFFFFRNFPLKGQKSGQQG